MQAIEVLDAEHRYILRVLDATEQAVARARAEQSADPAYFLQLAQFIEVFADGAHHAKEEDVLFRALEDFGLVADGGPIQCMLSEHVMGRDLRQRLATAARALAGGDRQALGELLEAAAGYGELMRSHIRKEDVVLYPMAEQLLPEDVFETMIGRYAEVTQITDADFARAAEALTGYFAAPRVVKNLGGGQPAARGP
jgi:hemerythrin-like domain-containing protein